MTVAATQRALMARLAAVSGLPPIVWPNRDATAVTPRIEVQQFTAQPQRIAITGQHIERGFMQATVVVDLGEGATQSDPIAQAIRDAFPVDHRETFAGGFAQIIERPQIGGGRKEDASFRVPVTIRWVGHF